MNTSTPLSAPASPDILARLLRGAWLGVLLGLVIEGLLLSVQIAQDQLPEPIRIVADTVQKMSWSSLVCAALAAGQAVARSRTALAGAIGLVGAPIAFLLARSLHKATLEMLGNGAASTATPWLGAGIKGVEYALLGVAILWLVKRNASWKAYAWVGAATGAVSYGLVLWLLPAGGDAVQRAIVEIAHPVGCALAVYVTAQFNRRIGQNGSGD